VWLDFFLFFIFTIEGARGGGGVEVNFVSFSFDLWKGEGGRGGGGGSGFFFSFLLIC
jgi:hypothetical protein